jgi:hypothetical protein
VIPMSKVSINKAAAELEELTEEERRALRISRFHAEQLQPRAPSSSTEARPRYQRLLLRISICRVFFRFGFLLCIERRAWMLKIRERNGS